MNRIFISYADRLICSWHHPKEEKAEKIVTTNVGFIHNFLGISTFWLPAIWSSRSHIAWYCVQRFFSQIVSTKFLMLRCQISSTMYMTTIQAYLQQIMLHSSILWRHTSGDFHIGFPILLQFSILDQNVELDTVREYYFGVLKLARYVRFVFDKASWPQEVQCVRLELIGCPAGGKIHVLLHTLLFRRWRSERSQ